MVTEQPIIDDPALWAVCVGDINYGSYADLGLPVEGTQVRDISAKLPSRRPDLENWLLGAIAATAVIHDRRTQCAI
ncbi:hypothetical protein AB7M46_005761 [Bradyrhizobium elkanii]